MDDAQNIAGNQKPAALLRKGSAAGVFYRSIRRTERADTVRKTAASSREEGGGGGKQQGEGVGLGGKQQGKGVGN